MLMGGIGPFTRKFLVHPLQSRSAQARTIPGVTYEGLHQPKPAVQH
jgi:hypothetical protein